VKPSALTDYVLLSYREAVRVSDTVPIVLPAPALFNQVVREGAVL
jgi:hypothetical protein